MPATSYNGPGRVQRSGRAPGVLREDRIIPRKLGHAVVGSPDHEATEAFFAAGPAAVVTGPPGPNYTGG